jgi:CRAL/TRIO domain
VNDVIHFEKATSVRSAVITSASSFSSSNDSIASSSTTIDDVLCTTESFCPTEIEDHETKQEDQYQFENEVNAFWKKNHDNDCYNYSNNDKHTIHVDAQRQEQQKPDLYGQIHPTETDEMIQTKLQQFELEFRKLPSDEIAHVIFAEQRCQTTTVNCQRIRLLVLRGLCYRITDAVKVYVNYWHKRMQLFGLDRAFHPLTISCLTPTELSILQSGTLYIVKKNHFSTEQYNEMLQLQDNMYSDQIKDDASLHVETRDIFILDYTLWDKATMANLDYTRVVWYAFHTYLDDPLVSKHGALFISTTKNCQLKQIPSMDFMKLHLSYFGGTIPVRLSGYHQIYMPSIAKVVMPLVNRIIPEIVRQRMLFHTDVRNNEQIVHKLHSRYGIVPMMIPNYLGGTYEWNMSQWIEKQNQIELNRAIEL